MQHRTESTAHTAGVQGQARERSDKQPVLSSKPADDLEHIRTLLPAGSAGLTGQATEAYQNMVNVLIRADTLPSLQLPGGS